MDGTDHSGPLGLGSAYSGHMTIRPESAGLWAARELVRRVAFQVGVFGEAAADLLLAVGEALSNAYRHGTPDPRVNLIYLGWSFAGDVLTVTVKDEGRGFAPREAVAQTAGGALSRGHGLRLMRQGVDNVYFEFDNGASVTMTKRVHRTSGIGRAPARRGESKGSRTP